MVVDKDTVDRLATLARLRFDDEAKNEIVKDLNNILVYIDKLSELDTDNVEPLIYMNEETNILREDEVITEITKEEALKNAPKKDSDYFKVPKVLKRT